ncbi:hypothetical protein GGX14DRAFT_618588 [Mycena pura]|uniref:Hydrophobin n=1 Tax=Mycena pura TaxID=153505 RepID=A0AAD6YF15_9AGAR|nr:hypothetical protein GGX14DRAFT_618588 [Mycena pura]
MFAKVSLAILAAITANFAGAAVLKNRAVSPDASPEIMACTSRSTDPLEGCTNIPVVSDTCVSFTRGLTFLNNELSIVIVPDGFVCSFFEYAIYSTVLTLLNILPSGEPGKVILPLQCRCRMQRQSQQQSAAVSIESGVNWSSYPTLRHEL